MATSAQRSSSSTRGGRHRGAGDADADADVQADALDREGLQDQLPEPLGERLRLVQAGVGQQDGELVAAEAGQQVAGAAGRGRSRGPTWRSRWSPAWWPRLSLTSLKPSRSSSSSAAGRRADAVDEHCAGPLEQRAAVGQPGELVGARLLLDLVEARAPPGR